MCGLLEVDQPIPTIMLVLLTDQRLYGRPFCVCLLSHPLYYSPSCDSFHVCTTYLNIIRRPSASPVPVLALGCARLGAEQRQVGGKQGFVHLKCSSAAIKVTGIHLTLCDECEAGPVGVLVSLLGSMRITIPWYVTCLWADWYTKVISTTKRKIKERKRGKRGMLEPRVCARFSQGWRSSVSSSSSLCFVQSCAMSLPAHLVPLEPKRKW